ncbi:MAG TPA: response regulator transcription factor [Bacteroidia bacterium]|nr:response regulator transcription factor [Bacteroidia bacterium]
MSAPAALRILIADDHQMFIDGIRALLKNETQFEFVGEASNGIEALAQLKNTPVDILITDINMPGMNGAELTVQVKKNYPEVKVLVLTMYNDLAIVNKILMAEAEGYILKNTGKEELINALTRLSDSGTFYSREIVDIMVRSRMKRKMASEQNLSPRETEIVQLIGQDLSTAAIAEKLSLSPRTVDTHRKNILDKTGCRTIVGLMKYAFENNLL